MHRTCNASGTCTCTLLPGHQLVSVSFVSVFLNIQSHFQQFQYPSNSYQYMYMCNFVPVLRTSNNLSSSLFKEAIELSSVSIVDVNF